MISEIRFCDRFPASQPIRIGHAGTSRSMDGSVTQRYTWQAIDTSWDIEGLKKSQLRAKPSTNAEKQLLVLRLLSKLLAARILCL
jgi:hypothetical protein